MFVFNIVIMQHYKVKKLDNIFVYNYIVPFSKWNWNCINKLIKINTYSKSKDRKAHMYKHWLILSLWVTNYAFSDLSNTPIVEFFVYKQIGIRNRAQTQKLFVIRFGWEFSIKHNSGLRNVVMTRKCKTYIEPKKSKSFIINKNMYNCGWIVHLYYKYEKSQH